MPQPQDPDLDPLLAFFEEHVKSPEPPEPPKDAPAEDLRVRVDRLDRQVERALIDITSLKSDLATLVGAVEEIKKRQSRPAATPVTVVAIPPPRVVRARTVTTILVLIALGAMAWGLISATTSDVPEPPPIESQSSTTAGQRGDRRPATEVS